MTPHLVPPRRWFLDCPSDTEAVADDLAAGAVVGHGFANFYAITARPETGTVRRVNAIKGRPGDQVGSVTTVPALITGLWDWSRLPTGLTPERIRAVVDAFFSLGPFGLRGPAAPHVSAHLSHPSAFGGSTVQVIGPGYDCPANAFLDRALAACGGDHLYITSANRSRHLTGQEDSPAHWTAEGLRREFGAEPDFRLLEHPDEAAARARFPLFRPMSTTILGFDRAASVDGRPALVLERSGSLPTATVAAVLDAYGFALVAAPTARRRLQQRTYATHSVS